MTTGRAKHESLAAALVAFQADLPSVRKAKRADTGKFGYTYADLADVTAVVFPKLAAQGLAFTTTPEHRAEGFIVTGRLIHESGEEIFGSLPLFGTQPQQLGSALTYARRYLLGALTGVTTDDDDDAHAAQGKGRTTSSSYTRPPDPGTADGASPGPAPDWGGDSPGRPRAGESPPLHPRSNLAKAMYAAVRNAGIPDGDAHDLFSDVTGRTITSSKELTEAEARMVLDHLPQQPGGEE